MWAVNLSEPRITWCRWPKTARYQTYKVLYSVMSRTTHIIIHAAAERTAHRLITYAKLRMLTVQ
jgi:hypothetical protein